MHSSGHADPCPTQVFEPLILAMAIYRPTQFFESANPDHGNPSSHSGSYALQAFWQLAFRQPITQLKNSTILLLVGGEIFN